MQLLASVQNKTLDPSILANDVKDVINLDYALATSFSTDDTTRRQYDRSYNPNTMQQLRSLYHDDIFSWHMFLPLATGSAGHVLNKIFSPDYNYYIVMEPEKLNFLLTNLNTANKFGITPRSLVNYLYYRLVDANSEFLPWPASVRVITLFKFRLFKFAVNHGSTIRENSKAACGTSTSCSTLGAKIQS